MAGYITSTEVYEAAKLTSAAVPSVTNFILAAEKDVDRFCQTTFWAEEDAGTATSSTSTVLTDSTKTWTADAYNTNCYLWIYSGTGSGQVRPISDTTTTTITVSSAFTTTPDNTSRYRIIYTATDPNVSDNIDGNGYQYKFLDKYPIQILESLSINGTTVTPSSVFIYKKTGKIQLGNTSEMSTFLSYPPQAVAVNHWYGVYPFPEDVKRFCILSAALKMLGAQMGGTYDTPSMYQMPEASVTVGQAYINIEGTHRTLLKEYDELKVRIPKYPVIC